MATLYQILLIISQKEFTKLNVKILIAFLYMKVLRRILEDINIYLVIKIIQTKLMKYWKRDFKNTFTFSNNNINTFILSLWKGVYPYENIDNSEKFNETTIPEKEEFYSNLKMEDITDAD